MAQKTDNEDLVIDTSKMSAGQRAAMEVTESARETEWTKPSFAGQLFLGNFDKTMLFPFPRQSEEDRKIGDAYCKQLAELLKTKLDADQVDISRQIPKEVMDKLAEMGAFAMKIPKKYDGMGMSQINYNRALMTCATHCGSTTVLLSAHQSIGVPQPLKMFGTEEQKQKYFPRFRKGAISAFALTEVNVGSDPAQMTATAFPSEDGQHYILNGEKLWCTNGPIADLIVVMAKTPPKMVNGKERTQISAFIVESNSPGVEVIHRCDFMGLRAIHNGLLRFKNVKVPKENILWKEGKGLALALRTLNTGRLSLPAACAGLSKRCLNICREWGQERVQWGQPVGLHEAGSEKIAYIASMTLAMDAITYLTSHWADKDEFDIRIEAAMAKLFCTEASWKIVDMTMQFRGGRGYERATSLKERGEKPIAIERMMRDARINLIIEGTSEIMHLFLAREALDPHLNRAAKLLNPKTPMSEKIATGLKVAAHYATWYPKQWINSSLFNSHNDAGPFASEFRYVDKGAHKLARNFFHNMAKYADKLERKQVILTSLTDIGSELFAMAATCSYALMLKERDNNQDAIELAKHFCFHAKERIRQHYRTMSCNQAGKSRDITKKVLNKDMGWLEKGIVENP